MVRRMLRANAPALAFAGMFAFTGYWIYFAHNQQFTDKKQMRDGVIRDIKRDRIKRREMERLQQQEQQQQHES